MKTFYGLTENPFALPPDPKFFYWSPTHFEMFQHLGRSQQSHKNIMVVTGQPGTGKTALLQAFANAQEPRTQLVFFNHAAASVNALLRRLVQLRGLENATRHRSDPLSTIEALVQHKEKIVLFLDNAHECAESLLEEIGILASIGTRKHKLFHIILTGPLSLPDHLAAPRLAPLRARVEGIGHLSPFNQHDTQAYIHRRLTVAGLPEGSLFDREAMAEIYRCSTGIPRAINQLCSHALLAGFAAHMPVIDAAIIRHMATQMGLHESSPSSTENASTKQPPTSDIAGRARLESSEVWWRVADWHIWLWHCFRWGSPCSLRQRPCWCQEEGWRSIGPSYCRWRRLSKARGCQ